MSDIFRKIKYHIRSYFETADIWLIVLTVACSLYGLILVASATSSMSKRLIAVQLLSAVIGFILMIVISKIDYQIYSELWFILLILSVLCLGVTLIFGTGPTGSTNRNWLNFGPVSIQPSEFVKLAYIIVTASVISRFGDNINSLRGIFTTIGISCIILVPLMLTGDLGMFIVYLFITALMLFIAGLSIWYFAGVLAAGAISVPFLWTNFLHEYQKNRIIFGFNPELDPSDVGYQAVQGKIAIGSGGFSGKGLFQGTQVQNGYVPAHHTDFIFSVSGEELGFIGTILLLALLIAVMLRIFYR